MREKLFEYGYKWLGMEEVPYEVALNIADETGVYLLYEDNTESLAENIDDIKEHYKYGGKFGIEINNFDNYVVYVLGRDLLKDALPMENDIAYQYCVNIAKDFEVSKYNVNTKGLYSCLEDYIKDNFSCNEGVWYFKGEKLDEICDNVNF